MPRGRPVKIVDSERRASMSLTNTIQNMLLDKTVKLLNKNERTVVHRICLNQKYVLKRHQQKVKESQVNYARIIGDKQLEDALKRKYRDSTVTMDDMEEADETLIRLWRQGQEDFKELRRRLEDTARKGMPLRPRTVFADLSNRSGGDNDVTERPMNSPIRRSGTSMSTAPATQRSSTSFSVSLPFTTTAPRSSTSFSMANRDAVNNTSDTSFSIANQDAVNTRSSTSFSIANQDAVNTRSSTSLSMANQSRRKSSVAVIFQNDKEKTRNRPKTVGIGLLPRRKENQMRQETPDLINSKTSQFNVNNSEEIEAVEECNGLNAFTDHGENGMLQNSKTLRPKTSLGHPTINVKIKTRKGQGHGQGHTDTRLASRKSLLPAFLEDEEEKPTLLQLHKERVKSANYIARIDTIVDEFRDWKIDEKNIIHDYYYVGQVGKNKVKSAGGGAATAAGREGRRISMKPAETKRYTGDPQVKNLTFPTLDLLSTP